MNIERVHQTDIWDFWISKFKTRHRLGYFRTHDRQWGGGGYAPPPIISKTDGRIEPREAFDNSPRDLPKAYLRF